MIKFSKSKGSVIADAAMTLPVFIISLTLMINCILETCYESKAYANLCEDTVLLSSELCLGDDFDDSGIPYTDYKDNGEISPYCKDYRVLSGMTDKYNVCLHVFYRPFYGNSEDEDDDYVNVYIFTKSGAKYHFSGCSCLDYNKDYTVVTKAEAISLGYRECKLCGSGGEDYFKTR